ncbi:hypothetical protein, partial [Xenorhabdus bovienii]|uniref:hypothetical protein n=1 Tax=Xenorhabdus bovienii TaxID=40576 RepID=UPI0023B3333C
MILLTATLSLKQRQKLADIWISSAGQTPQKLRQTAFPLATKITLTPENPIIEQPLHSRSDVSREVIVKTLDSLDACVQTALN